MWGNLTGWIISAILALGLGYMLYFVAAPPTPTQPTNYTKLAVAKTGITLPVAPDSVVTPGSKDCDAGDQYRKAIDDYLLSGASYEKFLNGGQMKVREEQMSGIADILGARLPKLHAFAKDFTKVVNYDNNEPALTALNDMGMICCTLGKLYMNEKYNATLQPEKAVALWEAAFVLGTHLYDERASWAEYVAGHNLMDTAASGLLEYYETKNDSAKVEKLKAFLDGDADYSRKLTEAFQIVGAVDENYAGGYAGDVFQIARSSTADKLFRAEAIKHIGHYRYNSRTSGDQLAARKLIKDLMADETLPPSVKAAAKAARDLTIQQHNMVGGGA